MTTAKQRFLKTVQLARQAVESFQAEGEDLVLFFSPQEFPAVPEPAPVAGEETKSVSAEAVPVKIKLSRPGRFKAGDPLGVLAEAVENCQACPLVRVRQQPVFGEGPADARVVFVGEAPGADDDREARPFAGEAGQLFDKILASIGLNRSQVYLCNLLKCRLPGSRNPQPEEIKACQKFLEQQLELLHPKLICTLGTFAAQTLLKTEDSLAQVRGRKWTYRDIPVVPTFHPESLLYHPQNKRLVWEDMKRIASLL